jgi:hypothetical protein
LCPLLVRVEVRDLVEQIAERPFGVLAEEVVAALQPIDEPRGRLAMRAVAARHHQQLGVAGCSELVDAELTERDAHPPELHSLRVPEGGRRVDFAGGEVRDRVEADRHPMHAAWMDAARPQHGVEHRVVRGDAGDPDRLSREVGWAADLVAIARDHRGERPLHDRRDREQVEPALARDSEVVDVHEGEVGPICGEQLGAVGCAGRLANGQVDTLVVEVAARLGGVDARVHRVRLEVEHQGRALRRARFSAVPSAGRQASAEEDGRQQRGDPSHAAATLRNPVRLRALRHRRGGHFKCKIEVSRRISLSCSGRCCWSSS